MAMKSPLPSKKPNNIIRLTLFWAILVFGVLIAVAVVSPRDNLKQVALSSVITRANEGEISKIEVQGNDLKVTPKGSDKVTEKSIKDGASSLQEQGLKHGWFRSFLQPDIWQRSICFFWLRNC